MQLTVQSTAQSFARQLTDIQKRQMPFARVVAATRSAKVAQADLKAAMPQVFDRPTRFTVNSLWTSPATKANPVAEVFFKDAIPRERAAGEYLKPQVHGGPRPLKRFERRLRDRGHLRPGEFVVPARGFRLNRYGNVSAGTIQKILSNLGAQRDFEQNTTAKSAKRRGPKAAVYFVPRSNARLPRGIYERRGKRIKAVFVFVRQPVYRARFDFYGIGMASARRAYPVEFQKALAQAVRTSNYRGKWK